MKKTIIALIIISLLIIGIWLVYSSGGYNLKTKTAATKDKIGTSTIYSFKDATYIVGGQPVTLVNGLAEKEIEPGSASRQITRYFGNEAIGDLNGDGKADVAFLLTQDNGGSGTFFYVAVALRADNGYQGTNAIFLGDRIAPQTTQIENGELIVNYADRNPGEPFSVRPSLGVSKYLKISNDQLAEVK
jgi:hypothetical protein